MSRTSGHCRRVVVVGKITTRFGRRLGPGQDWPVVDLLSNQPCLPPAKPLGGPRRTHPVSGSDHLPLPRTARTHHLEGMSVPKRNPAKQLTDCLSQTPRPTSCNWWRPYCDENRTTHRRRSGTWLRRKQRLCDGSLSADSRSWPQVLLDRPFYSLHVNTAFFDRR